MLDLAPEVENTVRDYATYEGISVNELVARTFPQRPRNQPRDGKVAAVPADDPVLVFLNARSAEADAATPEEVAAADAAYKQWQQNMDEPRRVNGERLLFPNASQP